MRKGRPARSGTALQKFGAEGSGMGLVNKTPENPLENLTRLGPRVDLI
jgi:hypothetical protein